ncbi:MAG: PsbP-related protein [Patescibacteria group bacterium]
MDPNQASQAQQSVNPTSASVNNYGGSKLIPIILGIGAVVIIAIGAYTLGTKQSQPVVQNSVQATPIPSPTPVDETANWKTYTNTKYGFSLKYPNDWFSNNCEGNEVLLLDPKEQILSCAKEPLDPIVVSIDTAKTADEYKNKLEKVGFRITNEETISSSGIFYSVEKSEPAPGPNKFSTIIVPVSMNIVLITINDQEYEFTAKQILSTFKFTP